MLLDRAMAAEEHVDALQSKLGKVNARVLELEIARGSEQFKADQRYYKAGFIAGLLCGAFAVAVVVNIWLGWTAFPWSK